MNYTYDNAGRRTSMTVAGQPIVNYTYDNANRLTQITQGTSVVAITYDNANRRTSVTLPNGVVEGYTYDAASRVTGITYTNGSTTLGNLTYAYDAAGNRTKIGGTYARTGLPTALSSATYNAANRLTNWGGTTLTYDANGNLTNDGTKTYTWDVRNRLASMTGASFVYDAMGRRVTKTIGSSTNFLYDGQNPVQELSGTTPTANLLTGLGIDQFFTRADSSGTKTLLTDPLNSTLALTDAAGTVQTEYTYEPFGKTTTTGTANSNSFQYTGRENDGTGLYFYRARYYSPMLQRFISQDIFPGVKHRPQSLHKYLYVGNNPIIFTDPVGLWQLSGGVGGTIGIIDVSWSSSNPSQTNVSLVTPQLGGGIGFCVESDDEQSNLQSNRGKPPQSPTETPLEELPFSYAIGSEHLGVSFTDDFSSFCLNLGWAGGPLPVNVGIPLFSF